jgi:hypothetical protein
MGKKKTTEEFIEQSKLIHGDKFDYSLVNYVGSREKIEIICLTDLTHGSFMQEAASHLMGYGCNKCSSFKSSQEQLMTKKEFIEKARKKHGDLYIYDDVIIDKTISKCIVKIICKKHGEFEQNVANHLQKSGCQKCNGGIRLTKEVFVKKANKIHDNKYNYDKVEYKNNYTKITITCIEHGDFNQIPSVHLSGSGCPTCKESKGERRIRIFLKENNINFVAQKKFDNCVGLRHKLPFDFFLKDLNILIEYDGEQHFNLVYEHLIGIELSTEKFNKIKTRDKIKNKYAKDNNIRLIRIPYTKFDKIEEILKNEIN